MHLFTLYNFPLILSTIFSLARSIAFYATIRNIGLSLSTPVIYCYIFDFVAPDVQLPNALE